MVKLGTFVALCVRGVESLRIGVLTWVSFMLKWVKQIGIEISPVLRDLITVIFCY